MISSPALARVPRMPPAVASHRPSGLKAMHSTGLWCSFSQRRRRPSFASQTLTDQSLDAAASRVPSGLKASVLRGNALR